MSRCSGDGGDGHDGGNSGDQVSGDSRASDGSRASGKDGGRGEETRRQVVLLQHLPLSHCMFLAATGFNLWKSMEGVCEGGCLGGYSET